MARSDGQFILPKIVPVLLEGMERAAANEHDMTYKESIALGLIEVLENAHHKLLDEWEKALTLSIYRGVCDELLRVRNATGKALNVADSKARLFAFNNDLDKLQPPLNAQEIRSFMMITQTRGEVFITKHVNPKLLAIVERKCAAIEATQAERGHDHDGDHCLLLIFGMLELLIYLIASGALDLS